MSAESPSARASRRRRELGWIPAIERPEHGVWVALRRRCENHRDPNFKHYGGRGIKVCERWTRRRGGFRNFLWDMGERPSPEHTIERKDVDGPYSPENCIWIHRSRQAANKTTSVRLTIDGRTQCAADWAREVGLSRQLVHLRLKGGATARQALGLDPLPRRRRRRTLTLPSPTTPTTEAAA